MSKFSNSEHPALVAVPPLARFLVLYSVLYAAFGVASPFLPSFLEARGIAPQQVGTILAVGTGIRLVSAPLAARLADRLQALRLVLAGCAIAASIAVVALRDAHGVPAILVVMALYASALAPTSNLADALALVASNRGGCGFEYGWVRGAGSAAFIIGSLIAGHAVATHGLNVIPWCQAPILAALPLAAWLVPPISTSPVRPAAAPSRASVAALLRLAAFRRIVLVAALVLGSHAMHDTFAVIRWRAAGVSPEIASALWSVSVAAEVVVFLGIGPALLRRIPPSGAMALAAAAGAVRWLAAAFSADVLVLSLTQPLHGMTFALLHLAAMRLLADLVPGELAATAQAIYGTVGVGLATALLIFASGWLYAGLGAHAFLVMSLLCLAALPLAASLRQTASGTSAHGR